MTNLAAPRGNTDDRQKHEATLCLTYRPSSHQATGEIIDSGTGNISFWPKADMSQCTAHIRYAGKADTALIPRDHLLAEKLIRFLRARLCGQ